MKKKLQPNSQKTRIIFKNGSSYNKTWGLKKTFLKLEVDFNTKNLWTNQNSIKNS